MAGAAYPLAAARALVAREEEEATTALARANATLALAEAAHERACTALASYDALTRQTLEAERRRDELPRTVADARLGHDWSARRTRERQPLAMAVDQARGRVDEARAATEAARATLASARAEREAVDKHHARWLDERRKIEEARAEAEADDVLAGRRR